uniref:C2H2-type domain-containing protein n=1 Tax=Knipowitschia caucasica TaxID=637954 RepID=A0AAV2MT77_KNICA
MGHIVEQCTQALSKFIKPQSSRQLAVDLSRDKAKDTSSLALREQMREEQLIQQMEDESSNDADEDDDDDVIIEPKSPPIFVSRQPKHPEEADIAIVKVESVSEMEENEITRQFLASPAASLRSPEPQHSLINSTVDSRGSDIALPPALSNFPLSPPPSSPSNEKSHQRSYDKPPQWYHQCPKCARVFRQLENYANHLKMHKLFMCLLCGKTFTQKGNLHRHMRVHAGIKPFHCKICGKTFTQKCSLLDHLNLHSGDKPHRCNYCDMVFAHKPVLRKHLKQIHGKNSFDNANERNMHEGVDYELGQIVQDVMLS